MINIGKTIQISTLAFGIALGGLTLTAQGCGTTAQQTKSADEKACGAGGCGDKAADDGKKKEEGAKADKKSEKKGDEQACGAGGCGN